MAAKAVLLTATMLFALTATAATANETLVPLQADAGADQRVECVGPAGAPVHLDGSGSTPATNGTIRLYEWLEGSHVLATGAEANVSLSLGAHAITLRVWNETNGSANDTTNVTVVDTHAPTITVAPSITDLGAPNHRMVPVAFAVSVHDTCDAAPRFVLVSATSNEAADALGSGHTSPDIQGADVGTPDTSLSLRAERAGPGDGRVYTIVYRATDASGNAADATATVTVAHGA